MRLQEHRGETVEDKCKHTVQPNQVCIINQLLVSVLCGKFIYNMLNAYNNNSIKIFSPNCVRISLLSHAPYMPRPFCLTRFASPNNV
jgi:hypothetical protein